MRYALIFCAVIGLVRTAIAQPAPASAEPTAFDGGHLGVEAALGMHAPLGGVGGSFIIAPSSSWALELGVGAGLDGPQGSAMIRYSLGPVVSLAAGLSTGDYRWRDSGRIQIDDKDWTRADWASAELSFARQKRRTMMRAFVGYSRLLPTSGSCTEVDDANAFHPPAAHPCDGQDGENLFYAGLGLRFAVPYTF